MSKKERWREYFKQYYQANKEKWKEYNRQYTQANRDKIREYKRQYYHTNKDKARELNRRWNRANVKRRVMIQYRYVQKVQDASGTKPCECGCGELIPAINRRLEPARFKRGHITGTGRKS